ncbi:carboxyl-terminal processing protease [Dysgonomonas sp. PFB1-18]|uniref:S41 family peptidase n=1 Tax=unclassified Dysgonomonas TaxID=2630389 RepID=UPI00247412CE|nr:MULTISPECIES: S41 family peptidase [unclassified Dysgonomonas]MDL2303151.1 S41 family peptidase [Dysgonomonas sp. OttesenSCG-928-D17]MDH6308253.1 carboxyl-terminal processing protease [Dysgonomonas sp. PF1-14]MDH6338308.1 carboxyl-terminal processing protease [Dysgonomonas sp. PF1-16]MDH6379805.1 carboxyl-terminal processing protease [Dysgonomonas sp. PFB1-18]MDH6397105.1 carboxyl-terminal processing protease [Dysgonomonas sp. PF1-23]
MRRITISVLCFFVIALNVSAQFKMSEGSKKLATTMAVIENLYVDKVDDNKLAEDAIKSLLEKLDPHSTYISADEVKEMNEPLEGNFDGIGISFNMLTDTLYVIETIPGGPSEKVGIRAGDKILYVNDTLIAGVKKSSKYVTSHLKGPKGTSVNVKVLRRGVPDLLSFKITRAKIPVYSIDASYMIDQNTGYIHLMRFGATTASEFSDAVKKLKGMGMTNLILDLENNGGGYMAPAIDLADEFLDKGKLIVYTEGSRQPRRDEVSTAKGSFENGKVVIMINEGSASASEILSGAVQDWDRGVIVGRRSFGKGLVQRPIPLPDESMIRLTVARYYTPTGRSIQKPYTSGDLLSYNKDVIDRYNKGEMMHADSIHFPDSLKYQTLVNKRTVYGGGGIMPDYFIPIDTTRYTNYLGSVANRGIINKIAYAEVDNHRDQILKDYPSKEAFYKEYNVPQEVLDKVITSANEEKIEFNQEQYDKSKGIFEYQIKALIGRDVYDMETLVRIFNDHSDTYKKAYEIIKDDRTYSKLLNKR